EAGRGGRSHRRGDARCREPRPDAAWEVGVDDTTVEASIRLGRDYFLPHVLLAFGLRAADPITERATSVLDWIRRERPQQLKAWEVLNDIRCKELATVEAVEEVLRLLDRHNYVRPLVLECRTGPGRKPAPQWEVNPVVLRSGETIR